MNYVELTSLSVSWTFLWNANFIQIDTYICYFCRILMLNFVGKRISWFTLATPNQPDVLSFFFQFISILLFSNFLCIFYCHILHTDIVYTYSPKPYRQFCFRKWLQKSFPVRSSFHSTIFSYLWSTFLSLLWIVNLSVMKDLTLQKRLLDLNVIWDLYFVLTYFATNSNYL